MHPRLCVLTQSEWDAEQKFLTDEISQMRERSGEFSKYQTRSEKIALALSKRSGKTFQKVTSMEPRLPVDGESKLSKAP